MMDLSQHIADDLRLQGLMTRPDPQETSDGFRLITLWPRGGRSNDVIAKLTYKFDPPHKLSALRGMYTYGIWKGCNVGKTMLQRFTHETLIHGMTSIELRTVVGEGCSFWSRMGALPEDGLNRLSCAFAEIRQYTNPELPDIDFVRMAQAESALNSGDDVNQVWFGLSEKEHQGGLTTDCLGALTNQLIIDCNSNMTLDLQDPRVLTRIGVVAPALSLSGL